MNQYHYFFQLNGPYDDITSDEEDTDQKILEDITSQEEQKLDNVISDVEGTILDYVDDENEQYKIHTPCSSDEE
uniref:Uncharacterized protein n=1 Tax=Romanomermis culicivorax TaxID=13658 RepID=A0A915KKA0_ROMCU